MLSGKPSKFMVPEGILYILSQNTNYSSLVLFFPRSFSHLSMQMISNKLIYTSLFRNRITYCKKYLLS